MKKTIWKLEVLHPLNQNVIQTTRHKTLKEISSSNPSIPFNTWRNIAIGRSKVYEKFIKLEKLIVDTSNAEEKRDENVNLKEEENEVSSEDNF